VLLKPSEGTQGREMNCKTRIASVLALAGFLCMSASPPASAGPLLSGYGGPGGGEQAIIGSALLGGPHGGSGAGGSSGSRRSEGSKGSRAASRGGSGGNRGGSGGNSGGTASNDSGRGQEGASGSTGATAVSSGRAAGNDSSASHIRVNAGPRPRMASTAAYIYPRSLRLASADSSALAISGGDLLALIAMIAFLSLVGVLTRRLVRLQR
jgi:hypothetical protein